MALLVHGVRHTLHARVGRVLFVLLLLLLLLGEDNGSPHLLRRLNITPLHRLVLVRLIHRLVRSNR